MHAAFVFSVASNIWMSRQSVSFFRGSFSPGTPTIITKSSLLSCWYVKHPIINYTPPIPLGLVKVVMLCWLMTDFQDRLRTRTRDEVSLTDSAENRASHGSIHRYRKLDWTNKQTNKRFWTILLGELTDANWIKENNHEIHHYYSVCVCVCVCVYVFVCLFFSSVERETTIYRCTVRMLIEPSGKKYL